MFLTSRRAGIERAYHILALAAETTMNSTRRLVYAATHESYLTDDNPLHSPIFLDHQGDWQSLVNLHPSATYPGAPGFVSPAPWSRRSVSARLPYAMNTR